MKNVSLVCLALIAFLLSACKRDDPAVPAGDALAEDQVAQSPEGKSGRGTPSFGGVTEVVVEAEGVGETPEIAVLKAIDSAVMQVNGRRIGSTIASLESRFRAEGPGGSESIRADAFVQTVVSASQGAVTGFRILSQEEIQRIEAERIIRAQSQDAGYTLDRSSSRDFEAEGSRSARVSGSAESKRSFDASGRSSAELAADASGRYGSAGASAVMADSASVSGRSSDRANLDASASERMRVSDSSRDSLSIDRGASSSSYEETERQYGESFWRVRIEARVARYVAPDEKGRPKLAIVMPRFKSDTFVVGDQRIPAGDVAGEIRARLSDSLTQTRRFIILDREFGDVLGEEAAFIESGNARNQELARIGQQMATDLLLMVSVDRFEYPRTTRNLRMSDRQMISYAGGGEVSLRLINATTGEVVMSESFDHDLPSTPASTMPRVIDGKALAGQMMDAISEQMTFAVVNEIFPISVIALNGATVVLSQGGQSVTVGSRYQAVLMGQELIDPQTGNSLGRMESPCCVIRIDRVAEQMSYGSIEGAIPQLSGTFTPGMIELRERIANAQDAPRSEAAAGADPQASVASIRHQPAAGPEPKPTEVEQKIEPVEDDSNW
jgi:curli biogenesis system outer membrane secretion channel CsgG